MLFFVHASSAIPSFSSIAWDLAQIWRINLCHGPNPGSLCEWWKRSYRYRYVNGRKEVTNIGFKNGNAIRFQTSGGQDLY
ncbi:hypothetical protein ES319_A12G105600v1 [Gossypium barbadense]|uniref:Uncharacterized protein n=1 Tax=Gossypium barbadense TaxID=3634 RepID=A0A5J5TCS2_GOSBA|nr:hypothetical protein ES319_A12G105600v1 [Gossypium barbadense]